MFRTKFLKEFFLLSGALFFMIFFLALPVRAADQASPNQSIAFTGERIPDIDDGNQGAGDQDDDDPDDDDQDDSNQDRDTPGGGNDSGWKNLPQTGQSSSMTLPLLGSLLFAGTTLTLVFITQSNKLVTMLENI